MEPPPKTRAHLWSRIDGVTKWNGRLYCPCGLEMRKNRSQDERREFLCKPQLTFSDLPGYLVPWCLLTPAT